MLNADLSDCVLLHRTAWSREVERDVVGSRISQPSGDGGKKGIGVGIWRFPKVSRAMGEAFAGVSDRSWRPLTAVSAASCR